MTRAPSSPIQRLLPTLVWIETHLDADLSLDAIAAVGGLSPHHFHRVFRSTVGETARRYVQRLRVERGAFLLALEDRNVLDIALDLGFQNHETFTRAFRRHFGMAPTDFRRRAETPGTVENPSPSRLAARPPTGMLSTTRIRQLRDIPVAFIRHLGEYELVPPSLWDELLAWTAQTERQGEPLLLGLGHDSPAVTPPENLRFDACVRVTEAFASDGRIGCQTIPGGEYAMTTHVGPYETLSAAWAEAFGRALALKGYQTPVLPVLEIYQTTQINPQHALNRTELCIPLKRLGD